MIRTILCATVALILSSSNVAFGADRSPLDVAKTGTNDRGSDFSNDAAEIVASSDKSTASIKIGKTASKEGGLFTSWSLTASAPLNESGPTDIGTLDGLADSFSLALKHQWFIARGVRKTEDPAYSATRNRICEEELPAAFLAATGDAWKPQSGDHNCDTNTVKKFLPQRYLEYKALFWDSSKWKILWGIEGRAGYKKYEFQPPGGMAEDTSKTPTSGKIFASFNAPNSPVLFSVGAEYQSAYKAAKDVTICPVPGSDELTVACTTGPVEGPSDDDKKLLFAEVRFFASSKVGASFLLTHDFEADTTGVDLPVYFLGDKSGLRGGIRLGWRDDNKDLLLGVFVGKTFSLFQ